MYCVTRYKAARSFVKTGSVQKRILIKSYEYLQTLWKYFQDYLENFRGKSQISFGRR